MTRETRTGWVASVVLHAALLLLFLVISIPEIIQKQDFIEVTWGSPSVSTSTRESAPAAAEPSASPPPRTTVIRKKAPSIKPAQPVILPERRMSDLQDERLPAQKAEKLETPQQGALDKKANAGNVGEREGTVGQSVGERDVTNPSTSPGLAQGVAPGPGGVGEGIDKGVAFSIQWTQGGSRRRISGDLPKYPAGVNVEAQIKVLAVVLPDGSVKSVQPEQKADRRLEEASLKEVRLWKFEPLRSSQPQVEQSCIVTFLFNLK